MIAAAFDAGASDIMRVFRQSRMGEQFAAAVDHAAIEDIDVLEIKPCPDAMVAQVTPLAFQCIYQFIEYFARMNLFRSRCRARAAAKPCAQKMTYTIFLDEHVLRRQSAFLDRRSTLDMI